YWIVPHALLTEDKFHADIFASVWKHSSWRQLEYLLHVVPDAPAAGYAILAALQHDIDDSVIPYTLVVAADSLLDSDELATALALEQVFSDTAPLGFIPSEGAGGLLLFNPEKSPHDMWANAMTLAPVTVTR